MRNLTICNKNNIPDIIDIDIPGDKVTSIHLLYTAILLGKKVRLYNLQYCNDVKRILLTLTQKKIATVQIHEKYTEIYCKVLTLTDIQCFNYSRASIILSLSILFKNKSVQISGVGGCNFTERPIDQHLELLKLFGNSTDGNIFTLKTNYQDFPFIFNCGTQKFGSSVGVTANCLLSSIFYENDIILTNVALEPTIIQIIELLESLHISIIDVNELSKSIKISRLPPQMISNVSDTIDCIINPDQTYFASIVAIATILSVKVRANNVVKQVGFEYIYDICSIDFVEKHCIIDGTKCNLLDNTEVICDVFPGFLTDIAPIYFSLHVATNLNIKITDKVYTSRSKHAEQLKNLGYNIQVIDNTTIFQKYPVILPLQIILDCSDIRTGMSLLIFAISTNSIVKLTNFEQIERGYCDILNVLSKFKIQYVIESDEKVEKPFNNCFNLDPMISQVNLDLKKLSYMGSCVTRNIFRILNHSNITDALHSDWDIIYNPESMANELDRILNDKILSDKYYRYEKDGNIVYKDSIRNWLKADSIESLNELNLTTNNIFRLQIKNAKTFWINLSLNQVWQDKSGYIYNRVPIELGIEKISTQFDMVLIDKDRTKIALRNIDNTLKQINPDIVLICSVSPTSLKYSSGELSTFQINQDSKNCMLHSVTEFILENSMRNIYYFDLFEFVEKSKLKNKTIWQEDGRHLNLDTIFEIAQHFLYRFNMKNLHTLSKDNFSIPAVDQDGNVIGYRYN